MQVTLGGHQGPNPSSAAACAALQVPPQKWFENKRFAKINCAAAAALLAGIMAMLGIMALRAIALLRQQKQWTQRRWRLASIHSVLLLVQVRFTLTSDQGGSQGHVMVNHTPACMSVRICRSCHWPVIRYSASRCPTQCCTWVSTYGR